MPSTYPRRGFCVFSHFKGVVRQTTNAHRLVLKSYLMGGEEMQHKMLDQLFAAYFEEERDIGCFDSLSNAAVKAAVFPTQTEVSETPISTLNPTSYFTSSMASFRPRNLLPLYTLLGTGTIVSRRKPGSAPNNSPKKSGCSSKTQASKVSKASLVLSSTTPGLSRVPKSRTHSSRCVMLRRPRHWSMTTLTLCSPCASLYILIVLANCPSYFLLLFSDPYLSHSATRPPTTVPCTVSMLRTASFVTNPSCLTFHCALPWTLIDMGPNSHFVPSLNRIIVVSSFPPGPRPTRQSID